MKKPTIEELTNLINDYNWQGDPAPVLAEQIYVLYNPPLKPLSELHKDREACEAIWRKVHPDITLMNIQMWDDCTEMDGGEGSFTLTINSDISKLINVIHELGYDVQPETKTI